MPVTYEWRIESLDLAPGEVATEDTDIGDLSFADHLREVHFPLRHDERLILTRRDDETGNYTEATVRPDSTLPRAIGDATIPVRFHVEVAEWARRQPETYVGQALRAADGERLQKAREEAVARFTALAEGWVAEFAVRVSKHRKSLTGVAFVATRKVEVPWPANTRQRLYILAHEIGHVALSHTSGMPRYVKEFEAEQFAHGLLRRAGIAVPVKMTQRAKRYIAQSIARGLRGGLKAVDRDIASWAGVTVPSGTPSARYHAKAVKRVAAALRV